jgi:hypothetical protein
VLLRRSVLGALAFAALALPATASAADPDQIVRWPLDTIEGAGFGRTSPAASADPEWAGRAVDASTVADGRFGAAYDPRSDGVQGQGFESQERSALRPDSVTVMAWVRGTRPANRAIIVAKGEATFAAPNCTDNAYALKVGTNGAPEFLVGTGTGSADTHQANGVGGIDPAQVWDGRWHAVAGTFDAATSRISLALDGTIMGSRITARSTIDYDYYSDAQRLSVGRAFNPDKCGYANGQYAGQLDEVRLYDRALTAAELAYLQDPAAPEPRELPVPSGPGPVDPGPTDPGPADPGPSDPGPSTPAPSVPTPTDPGRGIGPALPGAPPSARVPAATPSGLAAYLSLGGTGFTSPDIDVLLLQIAVAMRDAVQTTNRTAITTSMDERKAAMDAALAARDAMEKAGEKPAQVTQDLQAVGGALTGGLQVKIKAPKGAASTVVASSIAVLERTPGGKLQTTEIALPTGVYPADPKTGITTAQVGVSPKAGKALLGSLDGDVLGVSVLVKPASLPASALPPAEAAQLDVAMAATQRYEDRVAELTKAIRERSETLAGARFGARSVARGFAASPHGAPATTPAMTKRQARRSLAKLRQRFRTATHARNVTVRTATRLAVDDFARAGSADATTTSFAIQRCTPQGCPFAIGG